MIKPVSRLLLNIASSFSNKKFQYFFLSKIEVIYENVVKKKRSLYFGV